MPDFSKARVMVVALDAADPSHVRELAAAGQMPTFARLFEEAAQVETVAPPGVFVGANWPNVFTANSADKHGYISWDEITGGTYERRETTVKDIRGKPIWERLSDAGKRSAVLDVPHTQARPMNGAMLVEWGCHDRHGEPHSWPRELVDELSERDGRHFGAVGPPPGMIQFAPCDFAHRAGDERTHEETAALLADLRAGVERKRNASLELLDRGDWDLFMAVMGESHCVGHQLWHIHDEGHYRHDAELRAKLGVDPVSDIYRRLDTVVAEHLERLGPDDTAYVVFAHGMTAHHDGTHALDYVLQRLDWSLDEPEGLGLPTRAAGELARLVPRALRGRALRAAAPLIRSRVGTLPPSPLPEREQRRWFSTPNNTVEGAVRLNLAGREPAGRVHPADRRAVLEWLGERLEELVNLDTGGKVVERCMITDDVYRRSPGDSFGDLYLTWNREAPIERVWSPSVGTVFVPYGEWRQGDHVPEGLTFAIGPGIRPGRRRGERRPTEDLGATFSAAAGLRLDDVDGRPIESILPEAERAAGRSSSASDRLARALERRAERRTPRWATREDLALNAPTGEQAVLSNQVRTEMAELNAKVGELERYSEISAMSAWLERTEVSEELLISVIIPTRDRSARLVEAVESVQAQTYSRWQLLVIDDGSEDGTAEFLRGLDDARVKRLRSPGVGACGARNVGLDAAHGDVIAYLDDDNLFDRDWLKAVAMTFQLKPSARVVYGARIYDDSGRLLGVEPSGRAGFQFARWDRDAVQNYNTVDVNVLAHRRSDARFDDQLKTLGDWDMLLSLAADTEPVEIPAIAAYYRTDSPGRLSTSPPAGQLVRDYDRVRKKTTA